MSNCCCNRCARPDGIWSLEDMIGAKARISSIPVLNFPSEFDFSKTYTIENIKFRVSLDGKVIPLVKFEGLSEDINLTLKDITIEKI